MMIDAYKVILGFAASIISAISLGIVVYGTVIGFLSFVRNEWRRRSSAFDIESIRHIRVECGSYLLLGLEFLIASDILETVLKPGFKELALLGGIVVIRIVLSYFLNREMKELK